MKVNRDENKELVQQILTGDNQAFKILIDDHQTLVSHIVFRMVTSLTDREDLCQDIFLKVYHNLTGFHFQSKLSTWIARIAYNTCLNYLDKKKIPLWSDLKTEGESLEDYQGDILSPEEYTEKQDLSNRLQREIGKLPVQFRTILTLFHLEEMNYREIGKIMDLPAGTVKSYLFRARRNLKERLLLQYQPEELCKIDI